MNIKKTWGFTIIEILVAVCISSILLAAMTSILLQNKGLFRVQNNVEKIQSDATFVLERIAQQARSSGFRGCISGSNTANYWVNFRAVVPASNYQTNINGIQGFRGMGGTWSPALDTSVSGAFPAPNSNFDVLTLRSAGPPTAFLTADLVTASSTMAVNSATGFAVNDYAMISNCSASTLFQIGSIAGNNITSNSGPGVGYLFAINSQLYKYTTATFYVTTFAGDNVLFVKHDGISEPLINGVEKFVVMYGLDTNGAYNATKYVYGDGVTNPQQVVSLRIGLVLKSAENNISTQNAASNTYTFNGTVYSPGDKYLRKIYYTTINLRNMVP